MCPHLPSSCCGHSVPPVASVAILSCHSLLPKSYYPPFFPSVCLSNLFLFYQRTFSFHLIHCCCISAVFLTLTNNLPSMCLLILFLFQHLTLFFFLFLFVVFLSHVYRHFNSGLIFSFSIKNTCLGKQKLHTNWTHYGLVLFLNYFCLQHYVANNKIKKICLNVPR